MFITIGILAYNEEKNVERTLRSLLSQSVFTERKLEHSAHRWEIVVVPNGCKDRTHEVAATFLACAIGAAHPNVSFRVESLSQPGKSNAWNELVHRIAVPESDVFVMIDADIEFGHIDTIHNCLTRLVAQERVQVVVDLPLKNFTRKPRMSLFERISAQSSQTNFDAARPGISGQFYCIRGAIARQTWMPIGLSVEDGFLNAMVATDCFRSPPDHTKVVRAQDASHYFEGLVDLRKLIRHEVRIVIGTVLNCFLCWDTLLFITPKSGPGAGALVRQMNEQDPEWYRKMMLNQVGSRGRWVVPFSFLRRRFEGAANQPVSKFLIKLPLRLAATAFDAIVFVEANRALRSQAAIGFW